MSSDQEFNPAQQIMAERQRRDRYLLNHLTEKENPKVTEQVDLRINKILLPEIREAIKKSQLYSRRREVTQDQVQEGRVGYTPTPEKFRMVKQMLQGKFYQPTKEDTVEETTQVDSEPLLPDVVRIHVLVDITPNLLGNTLTLKKFVTFIRDLDTLTPALLNEGQDTPQIKRVEVVLQPGFVSADGHGYTDPFDPQESTDDRIRHFVTEVLKQTTYHDSSRTPRISFSAQTYNTYFKSSEINRRAQKNPDVITVGVILKDFEGVVKHYDFVTEMPMVQIRI